MWKVAKAYTRGLYHIEKNMPCQDFSAFYSRKLSTDGSSCFLGALADGAGFAKYAHIGAKQAVRTVLNKYTCLLQSEEAPSIQVLQDTFWNTLRSIEAKFYRLSRRYGVSPDQFSTTLLFILIWRDQVFAVQVGDGFILLRKADSQDYELVFLPDKGEYMNETTFIPKSGNKDINDIRGEKKSEVRFYMKSEQVDFFALSTDGIENVAFHVKNWQPHPGFFKPLEDHLSVSSPKNFERDLLRFLRTKELREKNRDDKSMLVGQRNYGVELNAVT